MFLHIEVLGLLVSVTASPNGAPLVTDCSPPNNYSNGLDIVKRRDPEQDEEYVTSFYKRVRDNRRAMFGKVSTSPDAASRRGHAFDHHLDHSLDHYFDHHLSSMKSKTMTNSPSAPAATSASAPSIGAARSVRGGGAAPRVVSGRTSSSHLHRVAEDDRVGEHRDGRIGDKSKLSHFKRQIRHRVNKRNSLESHRRHGQCSVDVPHHESNYRDTYGEYGAAEGDYPEHHLGLLRVPCSIAINSGEASLGHHHSLSPGYSSLAGRTAVTAYVDTGAQVTVISAQAAKRAQIYHLLDRRYAGRATGVGHCRVLGRIPARQVYFILGEGCHGDDDNGTVQMDGPALTVLEGTVTRGVDVLLGLDVLQDWEAEIRMGPGKSITVKKSRNRNSIRGDESTVEIPFANSAKGYPTKNGRNGSIQSHNPHRWRSEKNGDDEESFSPTASDIESDLDLLDRTGRVFPDGRCGVNSKFGQVMINDDCPIEHEKSDDYLKDFEEEEDTLVCRNEDIDLSGL